MAVDKPIGEQMAEILDTYEKEVREKAAAEIEKTAKDTAKRLKDTSPRSKAAGPHYAAGWAVKKDKYGEAVVYNRLKPQLTHLLQNGHAKRNGGRVPGDPHISDAEKWAEGELIARIERTLNNG